MLGNEDVARRLAHELTEYEAVHMIQGMVRRYQARQRLKALLRQVMRMRTDPATGEVYYENTATGETSYEKPKLLGSEGLIRHHKRAKNLRQRPDEAANMIVGLFRAYRSRRLLTRLIQSMYRKVLDESSGEYYYLNELTGASQWTKPLLLGSADVARVKASDMSHYDAAVKIQGFARHRKARRMVLGLVKMLYTKAWDEDAGMWYYYNTATGYACPQRARAPRRHACRTDAHAAPPHTTR